VHVNANDLRALFLLSLALSSIVALQALAILLAREWVKNDLKNKCLTPIKVRWRPFSWWPVWGPAFGVIYRDATGMVHKALCGVFGWSSSGVRYRYDEVIHLGAKAEVRG